MHTYGGHLESISIACWYDIGYGRTSPIQYQIRLEPKWIPRHLNERADYLSCIIDNGDWHLNPTVFAELDHGWGPHTVDRFASFHNSQLPRFNSRCWNPGSEAVDAFTANWAGETNWLCPPIGLIPRVIHQPRSARPKVH